MDGKKFRALDKITNKWIYFTFEEMLKGPEARGESTYELINWCEFTELKDKNCKEIYRGDIIEWDGYDYEQTPKEVRFKGEVVFVRDKQALYPETDEFINGYFLRFELEESGYRNINQAIKYANAIVIGNIYENPELIN